MKVAIVGSRKYPHLCEVFQTVSFMPKHVTIVSGGAHGVDFEARHAAIGLGLKYEEFPADWDRHGKSAGAKRNQQIVDASDIVIAFWDGESRGTMITVDMARKAGKKLAVVCPTKTTNGRTPNEMCDTLRAILDLLIPERSAEG